MHILIEFKEKYYINFNYFSLLFNINISINIFHPYNSYKTKFHSIPSNYNVHLFNLF